MKGRKSLCAESDAEAVFSSSGDYQIEEEIYNIEFEDLDEWNEWYSIFRAQLKLLCQSIAQLYPMKVLQVLSNHANELINKYKTIRRSTESNIDLSIKNVQYKTLVNEFDVLNHMISSTISSVVLDTKNTYNSFIVTILSELLTTFLQVFPTISTDK